MADSKRHPHEKSHGGHPHHMHALHKASATTLHKAGHIDKETHDRIVGKAERGMRKAKGAQG